MQQRKLEAVQSNEMKACMIMEFLFGFVLTVAKASQTTKIVTDVHNPIEG
jgi:hypothetical protein